MLCLSSRRAWLKFTGCLSRSFAGPVAADASQPDAKGCLMMLCVYFARAMHAGAPHKTLKVTRHQRMQMIRSWCNAKCLLNAASLTNGRNPHHTKYEQTSYHQRQTGCWTSKGYGIARTMAGLEGLLKMHACHQDCSQLALKILLRPQPLHPGIDCTGCPALPSHAGPADNPA